MLFLGKVQKMKNKELLIAERKNHLTSGRKKKVNDYVHLVLHSFYLSNRPPHKQREHSEYILTRPSISMYMCAFRFLLCVFFQQDTGNKEKTPKKVSSTRRPTSSSYNLGCYFTFRRLPPLARLDILCLWRGSCWWFPLFNFTIC